MVCSPPKSNDQSIQLRPHFTIMERRLFLTLKGGDWDWERENRSAFICIVCGLAYFWHNLDRRSALCCRICSPVHLIHLHVGTWSSKAGWGRLMWWSAESSMDRDGPVAFCSLMVLWCPPNIAGLDGIWKRFIAQRLSSGSKQKEGDYKLLKTAYQFR